MSLDPKRSARTVLSALPALALLPLLGPPTRAAIAQDDAAATAELPEARSIIDRFLEVTKTRKALAEHSSRKAKGTVEILGMGMKGTFELMQARPSSLLMVMEMPAVGKVRQGYDGEVAWTSNPMMGPSLIEGPTLASLQLQADFDAVLHEAEDYEVLETVGRTDFEGTDCYRVRAVAKPVEGIEGYTEKLRESFEYYAVDSGLFLGSESVQATDMGEIKIKTTLSDYVEVGGVLSPKTSIQDMGMQKLKLVTDGFEWDVVPEDTFALPAEIAALVEASTPKEAAAKSGGE